MEGQKTYFKYSKKVRGITWLCLGILSIVFAGLLYSSAELYEAYAGRIFHTVIFVVVLLVLLISLLYFPLRSPRYYVLSSQGLYIKLLVGSVFYPREKYDIATDISSQEIQGAVRTFGSGGYFGYLGLFKIPSAGVCRFYITNEEKSLIRVREKGSGKLVYISQ